MLRNYFSVRVYVIVDACLLSVWLVSGINGWHVFAKYPTIAALVWLVLTVPLAAIGLKSVYQRLQLHHRKNVHTQWEYEQQSEIRLTQQRQQYSISPPPLTIDEELDDQLGQVGHKSPSHVPLHSGVPPSQSVPGRDDFNVTVAYYLGQYPQASIREVERATGIPKSNIGRTAAWKNRGR